MTLSIQSVIKQFIATAPTRDWCCVYGFVLYYFEIRISIGHQVSQSVYLHFTFCFFAFFFCFSAKSERLELYTRSRIYRAMCIKPLVGLSLCLFLTQLLIDAIQGRYQRCTSYSSFLLYFFLLFFSFFFFFFFLSSSSFSFPFFLLHEWGCRGKRGAPRSAGPPGARGPRHVPIVPIG